MTFVLIGRPGAAKNKLYTKLTGERRTNFERLFPLRQKLGFPPGEARKDFADDARALRRRELLHYPETELVELPGMRCFSPESDAEAFARDYLLVGRPQGILFFVRGRDLREDLPFGLELIELGLPMVMAIDGVSDGVAVDAAALGEMLGITVVLTEADSWDGIDQLEDALHLADRPSPRSFYDSATERVLRSIGGLISYEKTAAAGLATRFAAARLVEEDPAITRLLALGYSEMVFTRRLTDGLEPALGMPVSQALGLMRGEFSEMALDTCGRQQGDKLEGEYSPADTLLTDPMLMFPALLGGVLLCAWVSLGLVGPWLRGLILEFVEWAGLWTVYGLTKAMAPPSLISFLVDGVYAGLGGMLALLPGVLLLIMLFGLCKASGVTDRLAVAFEGPFRRMGLSSALIFPAMLGIGCAIPALTEASKSGKRERLIAGAFLPYIPCAGKIPVFALLASVFFADQAALVFFLMYLTGMAAAVLSALVLRRVHQTKPGKVQSGGLKKLSWPSWGSYLRRVWLSFRPFAVYGIALNLLVSVFTWFLLRHDETLTFVSESAGMLAWVGDLAARIFVPLGLGEWRIATVLLIGLICKEALPGAIGLLFMGEVATTFTPLAAMAFLVMMLLSFPCLAAVPALRKCTGSFWRTVAVLIGQLFCAWVVSALIYQLGIFLQHT